MFSFVVTEDGSPSVRINHESRETGDGQIGEIADQIAQTESMHSLRGAFSETVYIYGTAIETCLREGFEPRIFSLGLGLGYVEILSAALFLKHGSPATAGGESFELVPELIDWFAAWVHASGDVPPEFHAVYEVILARTAAEVGIDGDRIRDYLSLLLRERRWILNGPLSAGTDLNGRFGCVCFDAFCSKTSPDLWTEDFLTSFFGRVSAPGCVVSTYACTGALKRSLRANGFELSIREGFASKRDSTFAVRKFAP